MKHQLKIVLPSILIGIKVFQFATVGEAVLGITIGALTGFLGTLLIWRVVK